MQFESEYTSFLDSLGLKYFSPVELTRQAHRVNSGVSNSIPHPRLWDNIKATIRLLDQQVRPKFGPIIIHSAFRNEGYNRAVGGASGSFHKKNNAIDFSCTKATPKEMFEFLMELRNRGTWHGGLGLYRTFVHVDVGMRPNADWDLS